MPRLNTIESENADEQLRPLYDGITAKLGMVPNIMRTMANSPAVLQAYLGFSGALAGGTLSAALREQIALVVGEVNQCKYCVAAHTVIGGMVGLDQDAIIASRKGESTDARTQAALDVARAMVDQQGFVDDQQFESLRDAGFNDGEIAEIVANVCLNLFTNYFNHVAETSVDFPPAPALTD